MNRISDLVKIESFSCILKKLYVGAILSDREAEFLLGCCILLLKEYDKTKEKELFEMAYNIILRYSNAVKNYIPLYDVSCNYGFYPTVKYINEKKILKRFSIEDALVGCNVERYSNEGYIETYEQNKTRNNIINSDKRNICFVAPTSSGKSSLIIQHLKKNENIRRAIILVPTKSLIAQSYKELRLAFSDRKILSHEAMYKGEDCFVGALTQERAFRLIERRNDVVIDCLYIDEAHNLFNNDDRNVLLSRVIRLCKEKNPNLKVIYLSPFINETNNLCSDSITEIDEQRISFNIKEPVIFCKERNDTVTTYNRFLNKFYTVGEGEDTFQYIKKNSLRKNFIFLGTPKKIETFTEELYNNTEKITITPAITELMDLLAKTVHEDFNMIKYISHGIIYLHAKMPDQIKEYLEYQFKINEDIKYLVANSVIMEGINLPIERLFVVHLYQMNGAKLFNLIGRVNRLNHVFDKEKGGIDKLLPEVHFIESDYYKYSMTNQIKKMNQQEEDEVKNPFLINCSLEGLKKEKRIKEQQRNKEIIAFEKIFNSSPENDLEKLQRDLIAGGMSQIISVEMSNVRQLAINLKRTDFELSVMDIVCSVFVKNINIQDKSFDRLKNEAAVRYYKMFLNQIRTGSLNSFISSQLEYQMNRAQEDDPYMYVGPTYGEEYGWTTERTNNQKVYVDVRKKTKAELVNLLIVKCKVEQEFLNFQYNRAVNFLHDYGYISDEKYNYEIYGTSDDKTIQLLNLGLLASLVNILDDNNQVDNIGLDNYGNLSGNTNLLEFRNKQNNFWKYELDKYFYFR